MKLAHIYNSFRSSKSRHQRPGAIGGGGFGKTLREDPVMLKTLGGVEYCSVPKCGLLFISWLRALADQRIQEHGGQVALTKLFNVLFVRALAARLPPSPPLVANVVCPGYCYSELRRDFSGVQAVADFFMERLLAFSAEQDNRQLVFGAVALLHRPEDLKGAYVSRSKVTEPSDIVLSEEGKRVQNRVWILGKVDPRVVQNVEKYLSSPA
ncbi:hypothetical protein FB451DRAFT_1393354 [Mycena latifolia]|nr:hypothetical protein FB451DRAFT_1393354 [Mycena latifolia]